MKDILHKTRTITSYNINYKGLIVAGADQYLLPDQSIMLEIFPFGDLGSTGLKLSTEEEWNDFQTIEPAAINKSVQNIIQDMLATMILIFPIFKDQIKVTLRKRVYEIMIEKNEIKKDLIMIYGYEKFVADQEELVKAIYVHDREEFDIWRFEIDAGDEEIYQTIYPALKALKPRKSKSI